MVHSILCLGIEQPCMISLQHKLTQDLNPQSNDIKSSSNLIYSEISLLITSILTLKWF